MAIGDEAYRAVFVPPESHIRSPEPRALQQSGKTPAVEHGGKPSLSGRELSDFASKLPPETISTLPTSSLKCPPPCSIAGGSPLTWLQDFRHLGGPKQIPTPEQGIMCELTISSAGKASSPSGYYFLRFMTTHSSQILFERAIGTASRTPPTSSSIPWKPLSFSLSMSLLLCYRHWFVVVLIPQELPLERGMRGGAMEG